MYAIYIIFLMTFLMSLYIGISAPKEPEYLRPEVVAIQMSSWHVAAQKKCNTELCSGGAIDPKGYLDEIVKKSDFVTRGYFKTTHDVGSNYIVTSLTGVGMNIGNINQNTVSASFHKMLGGDTSSSIGYWDNIKNEIHLPSSKNFEKPILKVPGDIPSSLLTGVPNGSPVMLNKISNH